MHDASGQKANTDMYESFYNLRTKPFALLPDSDFLYPGSTHRTAYSILEYGLINEAPFMVLTGEPGMGKTSLTAEAYFRARREAFDRSCHECALRH